MAHQPPGPPNCASKTFCLEELLGVLPKNTWGRPVGRGWAIQSTRNIRDCLLRHARDEPSLQEESVVVVAVCEVKAKACVKGFGFDAFADGVSHRDTEH
jgi:hypothetical protein